MGKAKIPDKACAQLDWVDSGNDETFNILIF